MKTANGIAAVALSGLLAACGGGGDADPSARSASAGGVDPATVSLAADQTCGLDSFALALVSAVNAARASAQVCGATPYPATSPLNWSPALATAATAHSRDMAAHNFFSHTGSDGSTAARRIAAAGHLGPTIGETLAAGTTSPQATVDALMKSPPHCEVLMNTRLNKLGAACVKNKATTYKTYWSLDFGA